MVIILLDVILVYLSIYNDIILNFSVNDASYNYNAKCCVKCKSIIHDMQSIVTPYMHDVLFKFPYCNKKNKYIFRYFRYKI